MGMTPIKGKWPITATLQNENGGPVIRINGNPITPLWLYGNTMKEYPDHSRFLEALALAKDAQIKVIMWVNEADDFAHNQRINEELFSIYPDCYVVLRMSVESPGKEGEYAINNNGKKGIYNSFGSRYWREDMERRFGLYFDWLKRQPYADRVIGFQPMHNYSGEWYFMTLDATEESGLADDYSEPARQCFIEWLKEKYHTDLALKKAWNDAAVTFETVEVPPLEERDQSLDGYFKNPLLEMRSIDYALFYRTFIPDAIAYTANMFKRYTGNNCLVGVMHGYNLKMNACFPRPAATGCFGLGETMQIEAVDFISCPCNYGDRRMGLSDEPMGTFDAIALHGKMIIMENDTRTHVVCASDYHFPDDYVPASYSTSNYQETIWETRRDTVTNTVIGGGMYWMDLVSRGWWNDPCVWDENQRLLRLHAAKHLISANRSFQPQVAFVIDEIAMSYITLNPHDAFDYEGGYLWHLLNYQTWELARSGFSYGYYTMQELPLLPDSVKMLILPHCYCCDEQLLQMLERYKKDGRLIVFMRAPGYVMNSGNSIAAMEQMTGIRFKKLEQAPAMTVITNSEDMMIKGTGTCILGYNDVFRTAFSVSDDSITPLGVYQGTNEVSFARKEMDGWQSVFVASPHIKAPLLRSMAKMAGCFCHLDSETDNLRTDGTLFVYHAAKETKSDQKKIFLSKPKYVLDVGQNICISEHTNQIDFSCKPVQTKLFLTLDPDHDVLSIDQVCSDKTKSKVCSMERGDQIQFSFCGKSISLLAGSSRCGGRLKVMIDGIEYPFIDTYSPEETKREYILAYNMDDARHTVSLEVMNNKNRNSASYGIALFEINIWK